MRQLVIATAVLAGLLAPAFADETVIREHHDDGPSVAVKVPAPGVEVRSHEGDCATKTVHKENDEGDSKTVRKTNCD